MSHAQTAPLKGSQIVIRCLERHGVDTVFAYPGGQAIELHQALSKSKIRVILPRHEQGGAFAAGGYARATGKVAVCMATSGPGATNLVSGIADAYMDSVPTVFITGQVPTSAIGRNAFQETDIIGVTRPIVKHSFLVLEAADIPEVMDQAFELAGSGRPGPVVVDIPKNVQQQHCSPDWEKVSAKACHTIPPIREEDIARIREMLQRAYRPCLYVGGGIISSGASQALQDFARAWNVPVTTTLMGIGAFPQDDPLSLSWLGMHGTVYANKAVQQCDLLLAFGVRFDDRVTGDPAKFAPRAEIVHVDVDESELNKNRRVDLGIIADAGEVLRLLTAQPVHRERADWFAQIDGWKKQYPTTYKEDLSRPQPQFVIETLSRLTDGNAVIVPGVGQHQMWAAQFYQYRYPRQLLTSGGLGAMGFGLPAAMGAKVACPEKTVINIDGDGSFQMNIQELGTLAVEEIPVKIVILNNQYLGMVAQWEDRFYRGNRGNTVLGRCKGGCKDDRRGEPFPDFVTIASGYGIPGRTVDRREDVEEAIREMLASDGPYLLDIRTGYEDHVLPMIPPGKDLSALIRE